MVGLGKPGLLAKQALLKDGAEGSNPSPGVNILMGYYCPFCGEEAYWGHRDYKCCNNDCHNHGEKIFGVLRTNRTHEEVIQDAADDRDIDVQINEVEKELVNDSVTLYRIKTEIDGEPFGFEIKKNGMRIFEVGVEVLFDNMEEAVKAQS